MSLKELNDNWERQFLGCQFSKRLEQKMLREHTERLLKEADRRIFESVVVSVLDRRERIKAVGLNVPNDLILNNFGTWLAGLIKTPLAAPKEVSLIDSGGVSRTVAVYRADDSFADATRVVGTRFQVGSGTTSAARGDYKIQTAFTVAPESGVFSTGDGSYAAGNVSCSAAITAGGSGTVNETGFFGTWYSYVAAASYDFMLFHDILAAGVAFAAGQIITVSYSISL